MLVAAALGGPQEASATPPPLGTSHDCTATECLIRFNADLDNAAGHLPRPGAFALTVDGASVEVGEATIPNIGGTRRVVVLYGGGGNDTVGGGDGNSALSGGEGNDIISGGVRDDRLYWGPIVDLIGNTRTDAGLAVRAELDKGTLSLRTKAVSRSMR